MVQEKRLSAWVVTNIFDGIEVLCEQEQVHDVGWCGSFNSTCKVGDGSFQSVHDGTVR